MNDLCREVLGLRNFYDNRSGGVVLPLDLITRECGISNSASKTIYYLQTETAIYQHQLHSRRRG